MKDTNFKKNQAYALFDKGQYSKAKLKFDKLCRQDKSDVQLWHTAGINDGILGQFQSAEIKLKHALNLNPTDKDLLMDLGFAHEKMEKFTNAVLLYKRALDLNPHDADIYFRIGIVLDSNKEYDEALKYYEEALARDTSNYSIYLNKGLTLSNLEEYHNALECYLKYLAYNDDENININIGRAYRALNDVANAEKHFKKALSISGGSGLALPNLISLYSDSSKYEKILELHKQGINYLEEQHATHSGVLFNLACRGSLGVEDMHSANIHWGELHGKVGRLNKFKHSVKRINEKLRIGYVSPDFRTHSVSYFFESILKNHSFDKYDIYCYSNTEKTDETTERLKSYASAWRDVFELSDKELANLIFKDKIDILVDLAGHTANNRLRVFTYKPAPVQVTYLGYFNATGIKEIDYWLTDEVIHPEDTQEQSVETIYRLKRCFYAYQPPEDAPDIELSTNSDKLVFGSFNHFRKITDETIQLWVKVLLAIPDSILLIKAGVLNNKEAEESFIKIFDLYGIKKERLELYGYIETRKEHLGLYNKVDICLDSFPFTGATTTVEALWMGVPTITLMGPTLAHRFSASFLKSVGLDSYCAESEDEYVQIAISKAQDKVGIANLKSSMRKRMLESSLCDGKDLASSIESFYDEAILKYRS